MKTVEDRIRVNRAIVDKLTEAGLDETRAIKLVTGIYGPTQMPERIQKLFNYLIASGMQEDKVWGLLEKLVN